MLTADLDIMGKKNRSFFARYDILEKLKLK